MYNDESTEAPKPAAYDAEGKPLYATPQEALQAVDAPEPEQGPGAAHVTHVKQKAHMPHQFIHVQRAAEPAPLNIPPEVQQRHDESVQAYPDLNLSPNEYVINAVNRHPIGLIGPAVITALCIAIVLSMLFNFPFFAESLSLPANAYSMVMLGGVMLVILFLLGGYAALWVYMNNRFFLTNESVIQEIQTGLFTRKEQTVSLANIEDASYDQVGPVQTILNYGSIRLSTEGDETTYRFNYVADPKHHIAILNNAVEAFKNGRPVGQSVEEGLKEKRAKESGQIPASEDD